MTSRPQPSNRPSSAAWTSGRSSASCTSARGYAFLVESAARYPRLDWDAVNRRLPAAELEALVGTTAIPPGGGVPSVATEPEQYMDFAGFGVTNQPLFDSARCDLGRHGLGCPFDTLGELLTWRKLADPTGGGATGVLWISMATAAMRTVPGPLCRVGPGGPQPGASEAGGTAARRAAVLSPSWTTRSATRGCGATCSRPGPHGGTAPPNAARTPRTCRAARWRAGRWARRTPRRTARRSGRRCSSP